MSDDTSLLIAGRWLAAEGRATQPIIDPTTSDRIGELPCATPDDLDAAAVAAARAFKDWRRTPPIERQALLDRAASLIRARERTIAARLVRDNGKPLAEALSEIAGAAEMLEWFGEEARRAYGRTIPSQDRVTRQTVTPTPIGPVAIFAPWNFPMGEIAAHLAPALAAGCTAVVKAPEDSPTAGEEVVRALVDAELPDGVVNFVTGASTEIAPRLIDHVAIRKIAFTGSTPVGKLLAARAASQMKSVTMELGGNAPVIVGRSADVAGAAREIGRRKFRNAGQVCTAPNRIYVHRSLHDRFVAELQALASAIVVGNGLAPSTAMGPLNNRRRLAAVAELTRRSLEAGAELVAGGAGIGDAGYFWQPTVLANVPETAPAFREEIFGPVAAIAAFDDAADVLERANAVPVGLAAYVFSQDRAEIELLADGLEFGCVGINAMAIANSETPFGGMKDSGQGRVGGSEGLAEYLQAKFVAERTVA